VQAVPESDLHPGRARLLIALQFELALERERERPTIPWRSQNEPRFALRLLLPSFTLRSSRLTIRRALAAARHGIVTNHFAKTVDLESKHEVSRNATQPATGEALTL
jgi:hypothetical protein